MRFIRFKFSTSGYISIEKGVLISMGIIIIFLLLVLVVATMTNSDSNGDQDGDAKDFMGYMDEINRKK